MKLISVFISVKVFRPGLWRYLQPHISIKTVY